MINTAELRPMIERAWKHDTRPKETTITFRHHDLQIGCLTYEQLVAQATLWKHGGAEILPANIRPRTLAGDEGILFVVSPPTWLPATTNMDPLSLCLQFAVNGFGFFTTDERVIELVQSYSKGEWVEPTKPKKTKKRKKHGKIIRKTSRKH